MNSDPSECEETLAGQWHGEAATDDVSGVAIIDIDEEADHYRGIAKLFNVGEPGVTCEFTTPNKNLDQSVLNIPLWWIPEDEARALSRDEIKQRYPESDFPQTVDLNLSLKDNVLTVTWKTELGRTGIANIKKSDASSSSKIPIEAIDSWDDFKRFSLEQEPWKYIYRGQPENFRLRTKFHRSHRKDLIQYVNRDIPLAYRILTAKMNHLFDLSRAEQYGAFMNLLQHHGYPTPLLDWTYSPFVAAFFAYRRRQTEAAPSDKIRIFVFDKENWTRDLNQIQVINHAQPHFSVLEALAIENPRALPQQSLSTFTNVDDIESYIQSLEFKLSKKYLRAIELPAAQRREVMTELSLMGITAGSLFPGLDGACEELYGRMFHL